MSSSFLQKLQVLGKQVKDLLIQEPGKLNSAAEGFADYALKVHVGKSDQLIVAFSGVGNVASGEVHFEWGNSLINACEAAHIIFIKDNSRQWYTQQAGQAAVVDYLQQYILKHGIQKTLAFGLSMGGYGALVFASLMTFDQVVALASRACVGKWADFDTRNKALMQAIPESALSRITSDWINPRSHYVFISSRDQVNDLKHFMLLKQLFPDADFYSTRGDHNLGHEMNLRGAMKPFLHWLSGGCVDPSPLGIEQAHPALFELADLLHKKHLQCLGAGLLQQVFPDFPPEELPFFLLDAWVQTELVKDKKLSAFPAPCFTSVAAGALRSYLGLGWYAPDTRGVWSQGWRHQLRGWVISAGGDREKSFRLHLHLEFFFPPADQSLMLEVWHEDTLIQSFTLDPKVKVRYLQLSLPVDEQGLFDVWLHTPFAVMPALHQKSEDNREIAVYLKSFVITHA